METGAATWSEFANGKKVIAEQLLASEGINKNQTSTAVSHSKGCE